MKVILLSDVYKHGVAGEIVDVADGFARNYLIPKRLAVKATGGELKRTLRIREQADVRRAAYENRLNELARLIDGTEMVFGRRASVTGKLFGSVTTQEIADELNRITGIDINRRRISVQGVREVGIHEIQVRLGTEISPMLHVHVVRIEELNDYLAKRAEAKAAAQAVPEAAPAPAAESVTEVIPQSAVEEAVEETTAADGAE